MIVNDALDKPIPNVRLVELGIYYNQSLRCFVLDLEAEINGQLYSESQVLPSDIAGSVALPAYEIRPRLAERLLKSVALSETPEDVETLRKRLGVLGLVDPKGGDFTSATICKGKDHVFSSFCNARTGTKGEDRIVVRRCRCGILHVITEVSFRVSHVFVDTNGRAFDSIKGLVEHQTRIEKDEIRRTLETYAEEARNATREMLDRARLRNLGLDVSVKSDGVWITFRTSTGKLGTISADALAARYSKTLVGEAIKDWAYDRRRETANE